MIRSTLSSGSGMASSSPSDGSTLDRPASDAAFGVRVSISGRKSSAITRPAGPVRCAAKMVSMPPPHPRSSTASPDRMVAYRRWLATPSARSIADYGTNASSLSLDRLCATRDRGRWHVAVGVADQVLDLGSVHQVLAHVSRSCNVWLSRRSTSAERSTWADFARTRRSSRANSSSPQHRPAPRQVFVDQGPVGLVAVPSRYSHSCLMASEQLIIVVLAACQPARRTPTSVSRTGGVPDACGTARTP